MKPRIKFDPDARAEVDAAFDWYEEHRQGAGRAFRKALDETFARITDLPLSYSVVDGFVRRAPVPRFPYGVYFVVEDERIFVLAVFHAKRNPQIWKDRL